MFSRAKEELEHVPQAHAGIVESRYVTMTVQAIPLQTPRRRGRRLRKEDRRQCRPADCAARCAIPAMKAPTFATWFWSIVINTFYYRDPQAAAGWFDLEGHRFRFGHDSPESYVEQDASRVVHTDRPAIAPRT